MRIRSRGSKASKPERSQDLARDALIRRFSHRIEHSNQSPWSAGRGPWLTEAEVAQGKDAHHSRASENEAPVKEYRSRPCRSADEVCVAAAKGETRECGRNRIAFLDAQSLNTDDQQQDDKCAAECEYQRCD